MRTAKALASTFVLLASIFYASSSRAEERDVNIENFTFDPNVVTVKAGTEVRWENHDDIPHSIVVPATGLHSQALDTDESYGFTFAAPGTFDYICGLHPQMKGKIVVVP
jgi:plastocyanin